MTDLVFFDKEGNYLNFQYDSELDLHTGEMIFHENSSDTFKTIGIYLFQKVEGFDFSDPVIQLQKFQLFNEYGFNITNGTYQDQQITKIEATNNDPKFKSKWIVGEEFDRKYPLGSEIRFTNPIFEFTDTTRTYTVVANRKGAIMIISSLNNNAFNVAYESLTGMTSSYVGKSISSINSIGIYNYTGTSSSTISEWSEPYFWSNLYNGRKLNLIGTELNDTVVTIKGYTLSDKQYWEYSLTASSFSQSSDLWMEVILKTALPSVYQGGLTVQPSKIVFASPVPSILKPGTSFKIISNTNTEAYNIASIPWFTRENTLRYYQQDDQVIWDNEIYQCLVGYTQSVVSEITPENTDYWTRNIDYLPLGTSMSAEVLATTQIFLNNNIFNFETKAATLTASNQNEITLASSAEKWADELKSLNISLKYENEKLKATLDWASEWATINFYKDYLGSASHLISATAVISEKVIEVEETMKFEVNKNISENHFWSVVFLDIDEYGIIININGLEYGQEVQWSYDGLSADITDTVDKTLRAWIDSYYFTLIRLGIIVELDYTQSTSPTTFADTLNFYTIFPNVSLVFDVKVGTTAEYYVKHSLIEFLEIGPLLSLNINGRQYLTQFEEQDFSVAEKIQLWIDDHQDVLDDYEIIVNNFGNSLAINTREQSRRVVYSVFIGSTPLPGQNSYKIHDYIKGNIGSILTSNSVILATASSANAQFFDVNGASAGEVSFATGMITSVNNSVYPFNNQEYNLIEVKKDRLVLSYQGPFWGSTYSSISKPNITVYYDNGFTQSQSDETAGLTGLNDWQGVAISPTKGFDAYRNYSNNTITIPVDTEAISDITDIVYVPLLKKIFVFGTNIKVFNAELNTYLETIKIDGMSTPVRVVLNTIDSNIYCLTYQKLYRIDPTNYQVDEINLGYTATSKSDLDIVLNINNGDVWVSCTSASSLKRVVLGATASTSVYSGSATYKMTYDNKSNHLWIISASDILRQFNADSGSQIDQFTIAGITAKNTIAFHTNEESVWVMGDYLNSVKSSTVYTFNTIASTTNNFLLFDNITNTILLSRNNAISSHYDTNTEWLITTSNRGNLAMSQYDQLLYLGAQNTTAVFIINPFTGDIVNSITGLGSNVSRIIYNAARNSIWCLISNTSIIEISANTHIFYRWGAQEQFANVFTPQGLKYGELSDDYIEPETIWLKTRDYIRKPRMNFIGENSAKLIWRWDKDDVPEMFIYDFSGEQLEKTGSYKYIGPKPLDKVYLNASPNRDLSKVATPEAQQTIFNQIEYQVDYINSEDNLSFRPEPLECFIGYKSENEGVHSSLLQLKLKEEISFTITPSSTNLNILVFSNVADEVSLYGRIDLATASTDNFITDSGGNPRGLKAGQILTLIFTDITNKFNQWTSYNNGITLKINSVSERTILVDFLDDNIFDPEENVLEHNNVTTFIAIKFEILEREIARIRINGQTEIEDIRYKTNLGNVGKLIASDDVFIFKTYDINEQGTDWKFLNSKRKEMLLVKDEIYPYVGSYKAIINAINYFGYNDLEFYEYYRNVDFESKDFGKLVKVEVPDIFDNTVPGWRENDWIKWTLPNPNFEDTNLFNLTYRITDREGNNVLLYTLAEVIIKLGGLKKWLQSNVIPITHRIYDITGRADFVQTNTIIHKNYAIKSWSIKQSMSPVDLNLNEAYLMPVNSGSSVYNCVIDFNIINKDYVPDYFTIKVKTYKTYPEWQPFKTYNRGEIVSYFEENWESAKDYNRLNNPRKYLDTEAWSGNLDYTFGQIVEWQRQYYIYNATQSSFSLTASNPTKEISNGSGIWLDITEWRRLDFVPVQNYRELRTATHSFNFTVDTSIDPYVIAEVISENGYGLTWTTKKSYEIRGIANIKQELEDIDSPGPIKLWERIPRIVEPVVQEPVEYITIWEAITPECS